MKWETTIKLRIAIMAFIMFLVIIGFLIVIMYNVKDANLEEGKRCSEKCWELDMKYLSHRSGILANCRCINGANWSIQMW